GDAGDVGRGGVIVEDGDDLELAVGPAGLQEFDGVAASAEEGDAGPAAIRAVLDHPLSAGAAGVFDVAVAADVVREGKAALALGGSDVAFAEGPFEGAGEFAADEGWGRIAAAVGIGDFFDHA